MYACYVMRHATPHSRAKRAKDVVSPAPLSCGQKGTHGHVCISHLVLGGDIMVCIEVPNLRRVAFSVLHIVAVAYVE